MADLRIELPESSAWRSPRRHFALGALVAGAAILLGTPAVDLLMPGSAPRPVGVEAVQLENERRARSFWDGSAAAGLETELRLRSRVRASLSAHWSALLLRYGRSAPQSVVVGDDGWIFARRRVFPPEDRRDLALRRAAVFSATIDRTLAAFETKATFAPIPRKAVLCQSRLLGPVDPDAAYDRELVQALRARGLDVLDIAQGSASLSPESLYLPLDSHWAPGLERLMVESITRRFPELMRDDSGYALRTTTIDAPSTLLNLVSIRSNTSAARMVRSDRVQTYVLTPESVREAVGAGARDAKVALVGSSFTTQYGLPQHLTGRLGQLVWNGGQPGTPFPGPLAPYLDSFADSALPATTIVEFPVYQTFALVDGRATSSYQYGAFVRASSHRRTLPLPSALSVPPHVPKRPQRKRQIPVAVFPSGSALSSGDGILHVVVRFASEAPTTWRLDTDGFRAIVRVAAGAHRLVFPVVQTDDVGGPVKLVAVDEAAGNVRPEVTLELDADLEGAASIPLSGTGGRWSANLDAEKPVWGTEGVPPHMAAVIDWTGPRPRSVRISVVGTAANGEQRSLELCFKRPISRFAAVHLHAFSGGSIQSVALECQGNDATTARMRMAPLVK